MSRSRQPIKSGTEPAYAGLHAAAAPQLADADVIHARLTLTCDEIEQQCEVLLNAARTLGGLAQLSRAAQVNPSDEARLDPELIAGTAQLLHGVVAGSVESIERAIRTAWEPLKGRP